jgi:hypothetical protein
MKQQQQESQMTCYDLYNNESSFSPPSIDNFTNAIKDEPPIEYQIKDEVTLPLPNENINPNKTIGKKRSLRNTSDISKAEQKTSSNNKQRSKSKVIYMCSHPECPKTFHKLGHLRNHETTHSGIKPYPCTWPECGWKFARSDELRRHFR